jgi:DNA-binding GntR family transcriptional regulator
MLSNNRSNTQKAVDEMRKMIFRGDLGPGSDHLEVELAEKLGMSRTPVREAALTLEAQGLVAVRPRKGVRVLAVSPQDMRDVYDVLTELESLAAENAAKQGYSRQDLQALAEAINEMDDALFREDRQAWAKADDVFHRELMRLGQNKRAENIAAMMEDQVRRAKQITLQMRPLPSRSNQDHRDVLGAIAAQDADSARRIHRRHREDAREMLLNLLEKHQLRHL